MIYMYLWQWVFGNVCDPLEVVVARVAEVGVPEAEEDGDWATVATLVLQKVSPVLQTHLRLGNVGAATANKLLWNDEFLVKYKQQTSSSNISNKRRNFTARSGH